MKKGIIFDLDGTLWEVTEQTWRSANVITKKYNLNEITKKTVCDTFGMNDIESAQMYFPDIDLKKALELMDEIGEINIENLRNNGGNVYDGVVETLEQLSAEYDLFIVSNTAHREYIEAFLISSGTAKYFVDYIAASELKMTKTEAINSIVDKYNLNKAIYVGDTQKDSDAAQGAKIPFVYAEYGFGKNMEEKYNMNSIKKLESLARMIDKVEEKKIMKINLHTHSNYSLDGKLEAKQLINVLKNEGFNIISITDHNTCQAYDDIAECKDIKIITGLEADAIAKNHTYDFLCYNFDLDKVSEYVNKKYESVEKRQRKIFEALVKICEEKNIKLENIDSYNPTLEYAHAAIFRMLDPQFLDEHGVSDAGDLYRLSTISTEFPLYCDMHIVWPDISELVEVIHDNNGKVFLAHPYRYKQSIEIVLNDVKDLVDGIEICNNPESKEEVDFLYNFAKNHDLLVSCGSDYHGNSQYSMQCQYITDEMISDILSWIES